VAFVTPAAGQKLTVEDKRRLTNLVRTEKGAVAAPSDFLEVPEFPETRSGKYMRRMVRAIVEGGEIGDTTTLRNPESLDALQRVVDAWKRRQKLSEDQALFERYRYFLIQYNSVADGKRVATVTVNNPPVNALNERAIDELGIIVEHLSRKADVAAVIFTGAGSASFVAGADIRQMLEEVNSVEEAMALPNNAQLAFAKIEAMGKPCIAAIQGVALGGGMEFALACHYRIAEPTARFGQPEINLRLLPGYGGTQRLPRLLADRKPETGLRDALDMILGGRAIDADMALSWVRSTSWPTAPTMRCRSPMLRCATMSAMAPTARSARPSRSGKPQRRNGKAPGEPIWRLRSATPSCNAFYGSWTGPAAARPAPGRSTPSELAGPKAWRPG
jgi:acrylyl-CoA reductase (NADPH)/3-hydroxypropionyl-CoA dehydratase/3-hydroxypropionyl-CoA synthetase